MTHPADTAAELIERAISPHREHLRHILATLDPLEAFSLLGFLLGETLDRFPADERHDLVAALTAGLLDPDA